MDNKKLFKFLLKDISEIEELFADKGPEGFDELEMEFITTRFQGAKHIIKLLSEKDIPTQRVIVPNPIVNKETDKPASSETDNSIPAQAPLSAEEQEGLKSLSDFEEELKQEENSIESVKEEVEALQSEIEAEKKEEASTAETAVDEKEIENEQAVTKVEAEAKPEESETEVVTEEQEEPKEKSEEDEEVKKVSNRIGDRARKEKSVNDLLSGNDDKKLEYKISNSPVKSIQTAIGINDRYQYIRELFDGKADIFTKTVTDLDKLENIQQAVNYLQENFKWKKNETSLKFVNLVKRRFPNG